LTGKPVDLAIGVLAVLEAARPLVDDAAGRRQLAATEQEWRERAARAGIRQGDPRARGLARNAAFGRGATTRARARFALASLLPDDRPIRRAAATGAATLAQLRRRAGERIGDRAIPLGNVARDRRLLRRALRGRH